MLFKLMTLRVHTSLCLKAIFHSIFKLFIYYRPWLHIATLKIFICLFYVSLNTYGIDHLTFVRGRGGLF